MLGRIAMLLVVLGLCVPSSGEILVYKWTQNGTDFEWRDGQWEPDPDVPKGYLIIDLSYDDYTISHGASIAYRAAEKQFEESIADFELVRVEYGDKVQWVIINKAAEVDGEEVTSISMLMLAGGARNRNVGVGENREVATKLAGYGLEDQTEDGGRDIGKSTISITLYAAWTYWANGKVDDGKGGGDFDATVQMIRDYLVGKGYEEEL